MLDTRYIHLHEALGLGAMWLRQGARILTPIASDTPVAPTVSAPAASEVATPRVSTPQAQSARLAALQKVGGQAATANTTKHMPTETVTPTPETMKTIDTQLPTHFSGSLKPVAVMVLSVCASPEDVATGRLFSGQDGDLLRKMLAAIGLGEEDVLLNTWLKDLPDFNPAPSPQMVEQAFARICAEYQQSGEPVLLLLGGFFERADVLQHIQKLGENVRYYTIAHPMRIASNPALKRPAWETLQQLQQALTQQK